jgi:uncharacterized protein (TIGR03437 family)
VQISWIVAFSCVLSAANYTTYIGDPSASYGVSALATDANGNTYVTGRRNLDFGSDIYVSKIDSNGNVALLASFGLVPPSVAQPVSGASAIAVDAGGNIFVAGVTPRPDFPVVKALQSTPAMNGGMTGFLVKLAPNGTILFSTYLGGTQGPSSMNAVALDSQGNVYVTGTTSASDYPHTPGLPNGGVSTSEAGMVSAAWFAKIGGDGSKLLYAGGISSFAHECGQGSTCFVSPIRTSGVAIAIDPSGNAYVAGNSYGGLNGTMGAAITSGIGAFAVKVNAAGSGLVYMTLLGSANYLPGGGPAPDSAPGNLVFAIAADAVGNAYIAGETSDPHFPATPGAFQTTLPGGAGANAFQAPPFSGFVAKINPAGTAFAWATYLGGTKNDLVYKIGLDPSGNVWVSGGTMSPDFPISTGWPNGIEFIGEFNPSGSGLTFGERFPSSTVFAALAFDNGGTLHTAGANGLASSFSPAAFPFQSTAPQVYGLTNAAGGSLTGRVSAGEVISIYGANLGPASGVSGQVNSQGLVQTALGGVQVMIDGVAAPLLYASSTQINAVAPVGLLSGSVVNLNLTVSGTAAPSFRTVVDTEPPEIFPAAANQDGTLNSASNPAKVGSFVTFWANGAGAFSTIDGQVATAARAYCACTITDTRGTQINVSYAGAAPGLVNGITQINFQIPQYTISGAPYAQSFELRIGASFSTPFPVYVSQ